MTDLTPQPPVEPVITPPLAAKPGTNYWRTLAASLAWSAALGVLTAVLIIASVFAPGPSAQPSTIIIAHGSPTPAIAAQLAAAGAIHAAPLFSLTARILAHNTLKAGEYDIAPHASLADIARQMHEGRSVVRMFMAAEGLTSAEIVAQLNSDPALTGIVPNTPPEGSLLPESYRYDYGDNRNAILARMSKAMQEKLAAIWARRDSALPLQTQQQALVLASIVEKETGKAEERPRIAGVFYNRLRINMRLQSDPTVIYALTRGRPPLTRALTHEDLAFASPINTYASDGLPPQPICNPGVASLQAATHPEHNDFLYFVADGGGGHAFAADLATQNQNINRWHATLQKARAKQ